jgi:hypothetical protein
MSTPPQVGASIVSLRTPAQRRFAEWIWAGLTNQPRDPEPPKGVNIGMQRTIRMTLAGMAPPPTAR